MKTASLIGIFTAAVFVLMSTTAQAVPSFARDTGKNCSYCHNAWPQLSHKGRLYKELGYRLPKSERMSFEEMAEENSVGVSALLFARPYDKKDSGDRKIRALHEAEIVVAGAAGKNWSGFFELEAEDEDTNARGFEIGIPTAVLSYNHNTAVNLQFTWGPTLWADPYGFLGTHFRMTRGHVGVIDQTFGGVDGKLRGTRQNITVTGRPIDSLFYSVGLSGEDDDAEGVEAGTVHARLAFDVTKDIMVGGFVIDGNVEPVAAGSSTTTVVACTAAGVPDPACTAFGDAVNVTTAGSAAIEERDYQRIGFDAQADIGNTRVQFAFVSGTDDTTTPGTEVDNDVISLQAYHVMKTATGTPTWVPLIRFDSYDKKDGAETIDEVTLNLTRYFEQNIKGYIEYWDRSGDGGTADDDRVTVQAVVGF